MSSDHGNRQLLDALDEDRARLSARIEMPAWLAPIVALLTAGWVASPAIVGLALYSTSLGLVSLDLRWWVLAAALATGAMAYVTTRLVERENVARVTRGR